MQPERVHQWWQLVDQSFLQQPASGNGRVRLVEVTHLVSEPHTCPTCSQQFPSFHALNVHIGKQHPQSRAPKEKNLAARNRTDDSLRQYAVRGLPQCCYCLRRFHAWPAFFGRSRQDRSRQRKPRKRPLICHGRLHCNLRPTHLCFTGLSCNN